MTKKICLAALYVISVLSLAAIEWPTREGKIVANFGSGDLGKPAMGDTFAASGTVLPADVGELVFYHDPANNAATFPSPLGAWAALDHGDNLVALYGRFEEQPGGGIPAIVGKETVIAQAGTSGWTSRQGFYFALYDRRERRWINPAIIISSLEDLRPPAIHQVTLRNAAGTLINPAQSNRLPQGLYSVFVNADDGEAAGEILAPNRIICSVNGVESGALSFETLTARDGRRMVYRNALVPSSEVYDGLGFGLGELRLSRGQINLVIEVRDIAENSRMASYRLNVE
ncbi:MAG: hypothetical protein LBB82_04790 [Treponema sp.]|jgi:hypothetical protein|nr:hypothetical protein [Treponema sp.]